MLGIRREGGCQLLGHAFVKVLISSGDRTGTPRNHTFYFSKGCTRLMPCLQQFCANRKSASSCCCSDTQTRNFGRGSCELRGFFPSFPPSDFPKPDALTHRALSSSFLGLPYRILIINHKKERLRGLWGASSFPISSLLPWALLALLPRAGALAEIYIDHP